jgi:hypothetical protein
MPPARDESNIMDGAVGMIGMNGTDAARNDFRAMPANRSDKRTILVVDDDPAIRNLIVEALRILSIWYVDMVIARPVVFS